MCQVDNITGCNAKCGLSNYLYSLKRRTVLISAKGLTRFPLLRSSKDLITRLFSRQLSSPRVDVKHSKCTNTATETPFPSPRHYLYLVFEFNGVIHFSWSSVCRTHAGKPPQSGIHFR